MYLKLGIYTVVTLVVFIDVTVVCTRVQSEAEKITFKLSVFYDDVYEKVDDIVLYSVDIVNRLYKTSLFQFEYTINRVDRNNSYRLTKTLCNELNDKRIAIIAIGDCPVFLHLNGIANSLKIPYISIRWESLEEENILIRSSKNFEDVDTVLANKLNIHPPANKLMNAITDLIDYYKWEHITILYQEASGLSRIENLIKLPRRNVDSSKFRLRVKQLSEKIEDWAYVIKEVKKSGSSHIIVDIETKYLNVFLRIAEEVGLMTAYFHFMFTTLDLSVLDYSPSANVTALQVFEPNDINVESILAEFNLHNMRSRKELFKFMHSEATFIYDAILLIANTIEKNKLSNLINLSLSTSVSCATETPWLYGPELMKHLRSNKLFGLSGYIEFDPSTGYRTNLTLSIVDRTKTSVDLIGFWRDEPLNHSIEIVRSYAKERDTINSRLNRKLNVTTKIEAPYVMKREPVGNETLVGNDRYKGYCVDLLDKIAKICNFTYTIRLVEDGLHGALVNGKWNGIVSELIDKKADLAVAALTISYQREQVIDFTKPFLNLGISILYKRPMKNTPSLFSFLSPLSIEIWLYMIAAYIVVSLMLFVLARFSPYEWRASHPCNIELNEVKENPFTAFNSFWFTVGSLMQQGIDFNPRACSTRILVGVWWFFALILISSYTANLAAFLTTKRLTTPIEDVEGLSKQSEIKYGCLNGGSTQQFFQESKIQTYERMWNFMSSNPDVFVQSTEEGIDRIKKGGYAYLVESITNEYMRQRDCELIQIGSILDTKGYGIGTPTGSPWRDQISNAILQLQENGELQELYTKWWEKEGNSQKCDNSEDKKKDSASELSLASVGGVFVVLAVGLGLSLLVAFFESIWVAHRNTNNMRSFKENLLGDLKFAVCKYKSRRKTRSFNNISDAFNSNPDTQIEYDNLVKMESKIDEHMLNSSIDEMKISASLNRLEDNKHESGGDTLNLASYDGHYDCHTSRHRHKRNKSKNREKENSTSVEFLDTDCVAYETTNEPNVLKFSENNIAIVSANATGSKKNRKRYYYHL